VRVNEFNESLSEQSRGRKGPRVNNKGWLEGKDKDAATTRDVHHDPWLLPTSLDLQGLASSIFEELEASFPRPPRQRSDAKARRAAIVGNIVTSLTLLARYYPEGARLAIIAENTKRTRYDRAIFSREVFMQIVSEMEGAGYLRRHKGAKRKARTTIEPTTRFRLMISDKEVQIGRTEGAETIVLKASTGRDRPKLLIDYMDTAETIAMRAEMQAVNDALGSASITIAGEPSSIPLFMTRRFQIDAPDAPHTFDQHGRLYGGLWQSLPKTQRHLLRVDGEPIADLDFAGMFVQLVYLEAGLALPNSDPYEGVEGLPRAAVKLGISALLCRSGAMKRLPADIRKIVDPRWNARRFSAALSERHPGIAHLFGKGIGLRLMKIEGDILLVALQELFAQGIPALPMHDGIMVPASKAEAARRAMARASMEIVGVALPVSQKAVLPNADNANSPPME
jgi:hypothetical protein